MDLQTNEIMQNSSGWTCVIFELDKINPGGLLINYDNFIKMEINLPAEIHLRFYRTTKKIILSAKSTATSTYAFPKFFYSQWKCEICKKISAKSESKCFCGTKSSCWTPVNPELTGVYFLDDFNYAFHFNENLTLNIID